MKTFIVFTIISSYKNFEKQDMCLRRFACPLKLTFWLKFAEDKYKLTANM